MKFFICDTFVCYLPSMAEKLKSEKVVVQAPRSFKGSAKRWWKITGSNPIQKVLLAIPALILILVSWVFIFIGKYVPQSVAHG